jgi:hypothetical protein
MIYKKHLSKSIIELKMKKVVYFLLLTAVLAVVSCDNKGKSEITVTTTLDNGEGKMVKKEIFAIKENRDGKMIDLKVENGVLSNLTIDGKTIAKEDFGKYASLTAPILKKMPAPPPPSTLDENVSLNINDKPLNDMDKMLENELKKDGFIKDGAVKYDFDLSGTALIINGTVQPDALRDRYLQVFKNQTGTELGGKFHIKLSEDRK